MASGWLKRDTGAGTYRRGVKKKKKEKKTVLMYVPTHNYYNTAYLLAVHPTNGE